MHLGAEAIFVGSGIFKSDDPEKRARAIVQATTHWNDAQALLAAEESLGSGMKGIEAASLAEEAQLQTRGW
jgi:pyridoxal 5'-phosphate synthase pdxS subunit